MATRQAPCFHQYRPNLPIINRRPECDILQTREGFSRQDLRDFFPVEMKKGRVLVPLYAELDDFDARRGQLHECPLYSTRSEPLFYLRIVRLEPEMAEVEGPQFRQTSQVDCPKKKKKRGQKYILAQNDEDRMERERRHAL